MMQQFDTIQKFSKDNVDAALKAFGTVSKGAQAIAVEAADYAKKSFEQGTATIEKLVGVFRVLLPHKIAAYTYHLNSTSSITDAPTQRSLRFALADEFEATAASGGIGR